MKRLLIAAAFTISGLATAQAATLDTVKEILEDRAKVYQNAKHRDEIEGLDYETINPS